MHPGRWVLLPLLLGVAAPARADVAPIAVAAGYGPVPVAGIGASRFEHGQSREVALISYPDGAAGWILRIGSAELSRPATFSGISYAGTPNRSSWSSRSATGSA